MTRTACTSETIDRGTPAPRPATAPPHRHDWLGASSHRTSEGTVVYESCHCGAYRVVRAGVPIALIADPALST